MKKLNSENDFKWYKAELDVDGKYSHAHFGTPERYPAIVTSEWWDNPNGPYEYQHTFFYEEEHQCSECGHKTKKFPITKEQENELH